MPEPIDFASRVSAIRERHQQIEANKLDIYLRAFDAALERYQALTRLNGDPFNRGHLNNIFQSLCRKFSSPLFEKEDLAATIAGAISEVYEDALENSLLNSHITEDAYQRSHAVLEDFMDHLPSPVSPQHGR